MTFHFFVQCFYVLLCLCILLVHFNLAIGGLALLLKPFRTSVVDLILNFLNLLLNSSYDALQLIVLVLMVLLKLLDLSLD